MGYRFSITYEKSINDLLTNLRIVARKENVKVVGNNQSGTLHYNSKFGDFTVSYSIVEKNINVIIERKPFLLGNKMIEYRIRDYLHHFSG